jgi:hypothetical protein
MSVLLVTYDLNKPGQNYEELKKYIDKFDWARLSESSYAIETVGVGIFRTQFKRPWLI